MIKKVSIILVSIACVVGLLWAVSMVFGHMHPPAIQSQNALPQPMLPTTTLTIGTTTITAELATTPLEERDGLSGRVGLAPNAGMLFVFDSPQEPGFWMKDMRFSLDIIYVAADGTIVTIYADLAPSTYPQAFHPSAPVKYVLEVPAGFAAAHNIAIGDKIVLQ